ncbi:MAG: hemerythrin family protein [Methylocystaceae bacterium]|nr:hemerythrin family protein [Methylocystaceae bacterium]
MIKRRDDNPFPILALWEMDATHQKAFELLDGVNAASDEDLSTMVDVFLTHTKDHFERERQMMLETDFTAITEHEAEHGRIVSDIVQFHGALKRGSIKFARMFFKDSLPEILDVHIRQVDSALAAHIKAFRDKEKTDQSVA